MTKGITYQSKDVLFRLLNDLFKDQVLTMYGLHLPPIKERIPGDLPKVEANNKYSDSIFLLEDGTFLILEFESNRRFAENHLKYGDYVLRLAKKYYNEEKEIKKIHVAVVYASDVQKAENTLDLGSMLIETHSIFMKSFDGDKIYDKLYQKVHHGEGLSKEEMMQFILLPLMRSRENRQKVIRKTVDLAKIIEDDYNQVSLIAGILTATDKYINIDYAKEVRSWLTMTKVERIIAQEIEDARVAEREKTEARVRAEEQAKAKAKQLETARSFLDLLTPEVIAERTGLTLEEVVALKN